MCDSVQSRRCRFSSQVNLFSFRKGDRIAQVIIEKVEPTEVMEVNELSETVRGEGGFGSTGVETEKNGVSA